MWEIWYENETKVTGETEAEWNAAVSTGVQVVVVQEPYAAPHLSPWTGIWDRKLWTGQDEYSINGWSIKLGSLVSNELYQKIWRIACGR